ncbi:MAG: DPP IV N-terminal domain-containing protein [Paludibacteraceae bacterium]|nr:DPP IV N-terminal domain-containing protein [Paludibacteraceae bacterium]
MSYRKYFAGLMAGLFAIGVAVAAESPSAPMSDGEHFCYYKDGQILSAAYKKPVGGESLFKLAEMRGEKPAKVTGFWFSPDDRRILLLGDDGLYYLYKIDSNLCGQVSSDGMVSEPLFSPDGKNLAFVRDNDIWVRRLEYETEFAVTKDAAKGVINGVREEAFGTAFGERITMAWLADGRHLAYVKDSELYLYSMQYKWNKLVSLPQDATCIVKIVPTTDPMKFAVTCLNERQNKLQVVMVDAGTLIAKVLHTDEDEKFITPSAALNFVADPAQTSYFALTQADGYTHICQYNMLGRKQKQLTSGKFDVMSIVGYDEQTGNLFYISSQAGPLQRTVSAVNVKSAKSVEVIKNVGNSQVSLAATGKYVSIFKDGQMEVFDAKGKSLGELAISEPTEPAIAVTPSEAAGFAGYILPATNPSGLVILVADPLQVNWTDYTFLTDAGYTVACFQVSGATGRGKAFEQAAYRHICTVPAQDYAKLAQVLADRYNIDANHLYIAGAGLSGSVAMTACSLPDTPFAGCVALRPVTDLRTCHPLTVVRQMQTQGANAGYATESPVSQCNAFNGRLLLVGSVSLERADLSDFWMYVSRMQAASKLFELQLYPGVCPCQVDDMSLPHLRQTILHFLKQ